MRDLRDVGKLALSVGRRLRDRKSVRRIIRSDLRSMTDTMFGATAVFAPDERIGVRSAFARHAGLRCDRDIFAEICALIVLLMAVLEGRGSVRDLVKIVFTLPTSLVVFTDTLDLRF